MCFRSQVLCLRWRFCWLLVSEPGFLMLAFVGSRNDDLSVFSPERFAQHRHIALVRTCFVVGEVVVCCTRILIFGPLLVTFFLCKKNCQNCFFTSFHLMLLIVIDPIYSRFQEFLRRIFRVSWHTPFPFFELLDFRDFTTSKICFFEIDSGFFLHYLRQVGVTKN